MSSQVKRTPTKPTSSSKNITSSQKTTPRTPNSTTSKTTNVKPSTPVSITKKTPLPSKTSTPISSSKLRGNKDLDLLMTPPIKKTPLRSHTGANAQLKGTKLNFGSPTLSNDVQQSLSNLLEDDETLLEESHFLENGTQSQHRGEVQGNGPNFNNILNVNTNTKNSGSTTMNMVHDNSNSPTFNNNNNNTHNNNTNNNNGSIGGSGGDIVSMSYNNNNNNQFTENSFFERVDSGTSSPLGIRVEEKEVENTESVLERHELHNFDKSESFNEDEEITRGLNSSDLKRLNEIDAKTMIPQKQVDELSDTSSVGSVGSMYDGFSYLHEILRLEGELKSKQHQLTGLVQETMRLERSLSKKSESVFELNSALHKSQETILRYEEEAKIKETQIVALKGQYISLKEDHERVSEELQQVQTTLNNINNQTKNVIARKTKDRAKMMQKNDLRLQIIKDYKIIAINNPSKLLKQIKNNSATIDDNGEIESDAIDLGDIDVFALNTDLLSDLYHHVLTLDNQLSEKEKRLIDLEAQQVDNERRNKELELSYQKISKEYQKYKESSENEMLESKRNLTEKITLLTKRDQHLQTQVKRLEEEGRYKDQEIKNLSDIIQKQKDSKSSHYEKKIQNMERRMTDLLKQNTQLQNSLQCKEQLIAKYSKKIREKSVVNFSNWVEDKKHMAKKTESLKELNEQYLKTIEAQRARILQLCDRIDLIAASLQKSSKKKDQKANYLKNLNQSLLSPLQGQSSSPLNNNNNNNIYGDHQHSEFNILIDESSDEEAELTDDLLDDPFSDDLNTSISFDTRKEEPSSVIPPSTNPNSEFGVDEKISIKVYELLEQQVLKLKKQLSLRDKQLEERDILVQSLEEKICKLAKSKVVDVNKDNTRLKEQLIESQKREKNYRMTIHKLGSKRDGES